jgi:DNA repair exonuclease SbcCD ATPase subunit
MALIFKKLRYQNFLSSGNQFTEIDLIRNDLTLISGKNGSGKSTILDALCYVLFNKPFRNITLKQLINTITNKGLMVELDMEINGTEYQIRRGMKPNVFDVMCNGKMIDKEGAREDQENFEKNHIKMNHKTFTQVVVLGSANYIPFMRLTTPDRRKIVEDYLDIQIFSVMNGILKSHISDNKTRLKDAEYAAQLCEQRIALHKKHIDSLKANNKELIAQKELKVQELEADCCQLNVGISGYQSQVDELLEQIADEDKVSKRKNKIIEMGSALNERIRALKKEIDFFNNHDECPTCKQEIDPDYKGDVVEKRGSKLVEITGGVSDLQQKLKDVNDRIKQIETTNAQIIMFNRSIQDNNMKVTLYNRSISELNREIVSLRDAANTIDDNSDYEDAKIELVGHKDDLSKLKKEREILDVSAVFLKDSGIKTKIVQQYIPVINKTINKYLADMDFLCEFNLDEEFNEVLKSRFRDTFSYESFSEGEKFRIDLALMFTWREVARLRNSVATNLLILDEVCDGPADDEAEDALFEILNKQEGSNVFVISHNNRVKDRFDHEIKFKKVKNFSRILW